MVPVIGIIAFSIYIIKNESNGMMMEGLQTALGTLRAWASSIAFLTRRWIRQYRESTFESEDQPEENSEGKDEREEAKIVTITVICHPADGCFSLGAIEK